MGDMLVKAGDWQTAQKIYASAKLSTDYPKWKFSEILENRIKNAQQNVSKFNSTQLDNQVNDKSTEKTMFLSAFSCMACHQQ